ncbi:unnamed protein product [Parnassius apollo]|uniref:(apollo) hypothetical protein n=1 Tax=Parnassius apollo TaxID=110799 RepID=A0A8S3WPI8_PARAO|nr:unnamed protein product [Parnassius apollo]
MDGSARVLALALAALALAARAHMPSHDNILRVQLWDAEGLSRDSVTSRTPDSIAPNHRKLKVNVNSLFDAMMKESEHEVGRFARHKVRHKRRRPRHSGADLPWRFHSGDSLMNVAVYDDSVPWDVIEARSSGNYAETVNASAVSDSSAGTQVNMPRDVSPPMKLRQDQEVMTEGKQTS